MKNEKKKKSLVKETHAKKYLQASYVREERDMHRTFN